jgi:hypothetical protein
MPITTKWDITKKQNKGVHTEYNAANDSSPRAASRIILS